MKKRILSILLAFTMLILLSGCGKKEIALKSSVEVKDWKVKLMNVEFADKYGISMTECFLTSSDKYQEKGKSYVCRQDRADSDKTFIMFELQMEYKGNKKQSLNFTNKLKIDYNDGYIVTPYSAYVNIGDEWNNWVYVAGESINTKNLEVDPLVSTKYILRGVFEVPYKIKTDKEKPLVLNLPFDLEYKIR